jgi:hypothetical protein
MVRIHLSSQHVQRNWNKHAYTAMRAIGDGQETPLECARLIESGSQHADRVLALIGSESKLASRA